MVLYNGKQISSFMISLIWLRFSFKIFIQPVAAVEQGPTIDLEEGKRGEEPMFVHVKGQCHEIFCFRFFS
jgi:hypothetical protein